MDAALARRQVIVFLLLTFAACTPFYWLIISAGGFGGGAGKWVIALMWCPGLAALVTRLIFQRNLRGFGWGWGGAGGIRYQVAAYFLPPVAASLVYGLVWASGLGGFAAEGLTTSLAEGLGVESLGLPAALAILASLGFVESFLTAAGEEIGWRGLLVPELGRLTSFTRLGLLSGGIWAIYHYPLLLFSDYHGAAPRWFGLLCFTVMVVAAAFVFAWFRLRSGSVWTAVTLHASHNLFVQSVLDPLTVDRGSTEWVTTEFGAGLAIVYSAVAYWCWRRRPAAVRPAAASTEQVGATP